jgi:hypothetical protein
MRDESALYVQALLDLTEEAPDGVFSSLIARNIIAQQAAIEELQTKIIHLGGNIDGMELNGENGFIKSKNYQDGQDGFPVNGFKLNKDGSAKFASDLKAQGAYFKDIHISGNSKFTGEGTFTGYNFNTNAIHDLIEGFGVLINSNDFILSARFQRMKGDGPIINYEDRVITGSNLRQSNIVQRIEEILGSNRGYSWNNGYIYSTGLIQNNTTYSPILYIKGVLQTGANPPSQNASYQINNRRAEPCGIVKISP